MDKLQIVVNVQTIVMHYVTRMGSIVFRNPSFVFLLAAPSRYRVLAGVNIERSTFWALKALCFAPWTSICCNNSRPRTRAPVLWCD
ncbi:hypothetical protein HYQ46_006256 [Verticillium longisporum]|nr:hypothetical protein HYQ46_006256 [Verticillium longisporum]